MGENFESKRKAINKKDTWIGLPIRGHKFIWIFFDRTWAQKSVDEDGAESLFGFDSYDQAGIPSEIYITAGGRKDPTPILEKRVREDLGRTDPGTQEEDPTATTV